MADGDWANLITPGHSGGDRSGFSPDSLFVERRTAASDHQRPQLPMIPRPARGSSASFSRQRLFSCLCYRTPATDFCYGFLLAPAKIAPARVELPDRGFPNDEFLVHRIPWSRLTANLLTKNAQTTNSLTTNALNAIPSRLATHRSGGLIAAWLQLGFDPDAPIAPRSIVAGLDDQLQGADVLHAKVEAAEGRVPDQL